MQRQRGELVPIGEVIGGLDGPVKAIREATPQALHHFTLADQVNQLVSASEADADLGFMAQRRPPWPTRWSSSTGTPRASSPVHPRMR